MDRVIDLSRNELSYPPPAAVIEAARRKLEGVNRYATASDMGDLKRAISGYCGAEEASILVTSGVEILLGQLLQFFSRRGEIIIIDPTFFIITRVAESLGTKVLKIRLRGDSFGLPLEALIEASEDASLVVIDSPNNPTGRLLLDRESTALLCRNVGGFLLVDESYCEFAGFSVIDMVKDIDNLIVARTMSKAFALAGLKIGYMAAGEEVLQGLSSLEVALRPTTPSACAAVAALNDAGYMRNNVMRIAEERERVAERASAMGAEVYPSHTNFLLIRTGKANAARKLKERGVLVFDPSRQFSSQFIRVSIGTNEENDTFLAALGEILSEAD